MSFVGGGGGGGGAGGTSLDRQASVGRRGRSTATGKETATATLRLGTNRLAFLRIISFMWLQFFWISLISGNRFHLFGIYRIFVSIMGSSKIGSRVVVFGSGFSVIFMSV